MWHTFWGPETAVLNKTVSYHLMSFAQKYLNSEAWDCLQMGYSQPLVKLSSVSGMSSGQMPCYKQSTLSQSLITNYVEHFYFFHAQIVILAFLGHYASVARILGYVLDIHTGFCDKIGTMRSCPEAKSTFLFVLWMWDEELCPSPQLLVLFSVIF